jgi:preprotein translocase subunit SecB
MDKTQEPGIVIDHIDLISCNMALRNSNADPKFELVITNLDRRISEDDKKLYAFLAFDLMQGVEDPLCEMESEFVAIYECGDNNNMSWDEFNDVHIVAHVLPYLREFISNMTNRMPVPVLNLPPVNAFLLVDKYRKKQKQIEQEELDPQVALEDSE